MNTLSPIVLLSAGLAVFLAVGQAMGQGGPLELYFAPDGDDANPGTSASPKKSPMLVMDQIQDARNRGIVDGPVTLWLKSGIYRLDSTWSFPRAYSGTEEAPLIIRGVDDGEVLLTMGTVLEVEKFRLASDERITSRLPDKAKGKVWTMRIDDVALQSRLTGPRATLAWNEHLLERCRFPNRGYAPISRVIDPGPFSRHGGKMPEYSRSNPSGGVFRSKEALDFERLQSCLEYGDDILVQGYLSNDWHFDEVPLGAAYDQQLKLLHHTRYGIGALKNIPRRFRLLNALSTLDEPGEWYFDPQSNLLVIWPVRPFQKDDIFTVPGHSEAIGVSGASHLVFQNLTIEGTGKLGMSVRGGNKVVIGGCRFRNGSGRGLEVIDGRDHLVTGCTFNGLHSALKVQGGNRRRLEPCGHEVTNCEFADLRQRGYGVVRLNGVGIRFAHNLLHTMNGALQYRGNDILIEFNEFYNMGWEMGDWNVIYTGADWAGAGNVIRYNFAHHLMELPGAYPVGAFRNDDLGQGTRYYGNVFYKSGRYAVAFNGGNNQMTGNYVFETSYVWHTSIKARTAAEVDKKWEEVERYARNELPRGDKDDHVNRAYDVYGREGWKTGIWPERYPVLKKVMEGRNGWAPTFCVMKDNLSDGGSVYVHGAGIKDLPKTLTMGKIGKTSLSSVFADRRALTFSEAKKVKAPGGDDILPLHLIGLRKDQYRQEMPDPKAYRKEILKRYNKEKSSGGKYDARQILKRYPLPSYLR